MRPVPLLRLSSVSVVWYWTALSSACSPLSPISFPAKTEFIYLSINVKLNFHLFLILIYAMFFRRTAHNLNSPIVEAIFLYNNRRESYGLIFFSVFMWVICNVPSLIPSLFFMWLSIHYSDMDQAFVQHTGIFNTCTGQTKLALKCSSKTQRHVEKRQQEDKGRLMNKWKMYNF